MSLCLTPVLPAGHRHRGLHQDRRPSEARVFPLLPIRGAAAVAFAVLVQTWACAQAQTNPQSQQETLKVAVGTRGAFENLVSEVGQQQGFFKKYALTLDVLYTRG